MVVACPQDGQNSKIRRRILTSLTPHGFAVLPSPRGRGDGRSCVPQPVSCPAVSRADEKLRRQFFSRVQLGRDQNICLLSFLGDREAQSKRKVRRAWNHKPRWALIGCAVRMSTGHGGKKNVQDFSGFLVRPTKGQSSFYPVYGPAQTSYVFNSLRCDPCQSS